MNDNFVRDPASSALINNDIVGLEAYKKRKEQGMKLERVSREMSTLQIELEEIKSLLHKLIKTKE